MMASLQSFIALGQAPVTLWVVFCLTLLMWLVAICRGRELDSSTVLMFAVNVLGVVTGIYIFAGAFDLAKTSAQNAIYSGISGFVVSIVTMQNLIRETKLICRKQVDPQRQAELTQPQDLQSPD